MLVAAFFVVACSNEQPDESQAVVEDSTRR
jgi:hypothetical protein